MNKTPKEFYDSGLTDRKPYEDRAKLIAALTLPYLIRDDSATGTNAMTDTVEQSYGGRLVNTLKAKMGMALLPPSTSSFRLVPDPEELEALTGGSPDNRAILMAKISNSITKINTELEVQQIRNTLFDLIAQMIVVGSVIAEKKDGEGVVLHMLQSFVAKLDSRGEPLCLVFVEKLSVLPDNIIVAEEKDEYELYTMAKMDKDSGRWTVTQEIDGEMVGKEMTYKNYEELPFRYLGWTWMAGESYHRPYSEDYYKDLEQVNKLAKLLTDGAIVQAKMLLFVNPRGGRTRKDDVAESDNGDVIDGSSDDVTALQVGKNFDFQVPAEREATLKRELSKSYLMNESVTRDAERVTAEEISFMARELETSSLSGIYSKMSLKWSKWIIQQLMLELKITFNSIDVEIITGLDALGRSQEAQKLDRVLQRMEALGLRGWFKDDELVNRYTAFEGVPTDNLVKTPSEVEQEKVAAQQAQSQQVASDAAMAAGGATAGANAANQAIPAEAQ